MYSQNLLLLAECKKYYPKATIREDGKIRLTKGNGFHKESIIKNILIRKMIRLKVIDFLDLGASNLVESNTTKSVYFTFENENYRISDHLKPFIGIQIIIEI